jgi:Domain of Unknown Function (DUF1080)
MKVPVFFPRIVCLTALLFSYAPVVAGTDGQARDIPPAGFTALFNGKDLEGWWGASTENPREWSALPAPEFQKKHDASLPDIASHWKVQAGELVNAGDGLYLTSEKQFRDFELLVDYKTVATADSGIYLKGVPQVQIWDYTKAGGKWPQGSDKGSGGLWNNRAGFPGKDPLVLADKPFGQWNHFRIVQCGSRTWVWLNEQLVVEGATLENYFDKTRAIPIPAAGPIQLQTHGGEIRWRNVFAREIGADEANRWLRGSEPEGFESVFNGKDLTGWAGPVENWEVTDGALVMRPTKAGTIYTKQNYGDFVARVEFKLPPGGNSGLAIRYPGEGDTAYVGMCELQVLDDGAPQYATLDPRQAHGSAYGMVAAHRGYLRPVGEWNYQEVTLKGSTIKVELNGTVILDCDLAPVSEFLANHAHPGKNRLSGGFGFAGHRDPVMFRHISIKRLEDTAGSSHP